MRTLNGSLPSSTALLSAAARGAHALVDAPPLLLDDADARAVCALFEPSPLAYQVSMPLQPLLAAARVSSVVRSCYARAVLAESGCAQVVVLGAGLDTSPYAGFPVASWALDRPAVLTWRAELFTEAGIEDRATPVGHDLTEGGLAAALDAAGADLSVPTMVAVLGLSMYLTAAQVRALLGELAGLAAGSQLVFDALLPDEAADSTGRAYAAAVTAAVGGTEPWHWRPQHAELSQLLIDAGWRPMSICDEGQAVPPSFWAANPGLPRQQLVVLVRAELDRGTTL